MRSVDVESPHKIVALEDGETWWNWDYLEWNQKLIDYCLGSAPTGQVDTLERLPATPEELSEVAGVNSEQAQNVAEAFVAACKNELSNGVGFRRFCTDFSRCRTLPEGEWNSRSSEPPHFFGMLWLTALICYGYPDAQSGFHDRYERLVGTRIGNQADCITALWRKVSAWTKYKRRRGEPIKVIVVPPDDSFRKNIGPSYFLAFPHQQDRRWLTEALIQNDLVGFEPPIRPVVLALQQYRDKFSSAFQNDFQEFIEGYYEGHGDVEKSAFWRAVRQSSLYPGESKSRLVNSNTTFLAVFEEEEFTPLIGCKGDFDPPSGFRIESPEDWRIGDWKSYVVAEDGSYRRVVETAFREYFLLDSGPRIMLKQGVLVFQEDSPGDYYLASGHDIGGADIAMVRNDLEAAFIANFGGSSEVCWIDGWKLVQGCDVMPLTDPPPQLEDVYVLQRSMSHPQVRFVGGVRLLDGYLALKGLLPCVRASGASRVWVTSGSDSLGDCIWDEQQQLWQLPALLAEKQQQTWIVRADWGKAQEMDAVSTSTYRKLELRDIVIDDRYKDSPAGHYFRESCRPAQRKYEGGGGVPLDVAGPGVLANYDFITFDPTCRWLGPGLGEMELEAKSGYDWMAIGAKNNPEALLFIGDPNNPTLPINRQSPDKGDRRHWRCAFHKSDKYLVRDHRGDWKVLNADVYPIVDSALKEYRKVINCTADAPKVQKTDLETILARRPERFETSDPTMNLVDALAALSVNRRGLSYRKVQELFAAITGNMDYRLQHELIRAWCEQGCFDQLRNQAYGSSVFVARRPRFVAYRMGAEVEATLVGLVTGMRWTEVEQAIGKESSARVSILAPGSFWQPRMLRVRLDEDSLIRINERVGLDTTEWLRWEDEGMVVEALDVALERQELSQGMPPDGYQVERVWNWEHSEFQRGCDENLNEIRIEQRSRDGRSTIYVVLAHGKENYWTYIKNWALLCGCSLAGKKPFSLDDVGWVTTTGRTPVHLPLTMGRVCTIAGEFLPGPILDPSGSKIKSYCYPFGRRLNEVVTRSIPKEWINSSSQ